MRDYIELGNDELNKLHRIQLDMLEDFLSVCNELKLRYFMLGGSVLGAIRHNGFIPWDDDIDIGMPRKDYEIFIERGQRLLNEKHFIQTHLSDPLYPHNFAKIRNNNTTYVEITKRRINMHHGVYIDVFPLDGVPKSIIHKATFNVINRILTKKINEVFDLSYYDQKKTIINTILESIVKIIFWNKNYDDIVSKKDRLLKRIDYDKANLVANYCGAWGKKEIVPRSYFGNGAIREFENIPVILPEEYHRYLKQLFGNYMELPKENERTTHHYCSIIDLDIPYTSYHIFNSKTQEK